MVLEKIVIVGDGSEKKEKQWFDKVQVRKCLQGIIMNMKVI